MLLNLEDLSDSGEAHENPKIQSRRKGEPRREPNNRGGNVATIIATVNPALGGVPLYEEERFRKSGPSDGAAPRA